jgi:2-polyprenyl-6-methoxyphenol hydroxylase-like FAD-dependent oxidoreductase
MSHYSVLIVGAGPVGMALAAELHRYGINFLIIDKRPDHITTSNAAGIHSRTLECWHGRPWLRSFLEQGLRIENVFIKAKKYNLVKLNFDQLHDTQYPMILSIPQNSTEEILDNYLTEVGCSVKRNTTLTSLEQKDRLLVGLQTNSQEEKITADYLVGCDGYHSTVRELANIRYSGEDIKDRFFLVDAKLKYPLEEEFKIYLHHKGILAFFVMPKSVRVIACVGSDSQFKDAQEPTLGIMNQIIKQRASSSLEIKEIHWQSHFWIHERVATHFQQGRIFLAGDAAHVHSPAGGQGMNTGIQDAYNLAWKLAYVIKAYSSPALLETYEQERRIVAKDVVMMTAIMTRMASLQNILLISLRNFLLRHISKIKFINKLILNKLAELSIAYPESFLSRGKKIASFYPGCRMYDCPINKGDHYYLYDLLNTSKFYLFVFNAEENDKKQLLNLHEKYLDKMSLQFAESLSSDFIKVYNFKKFTLCLVRPDRYIAYLGDKITDLDVFLRIIFL